MNKCENCGASYDKGLAKCPYCGTIEPHAAEAEYMRKLRKVRAKLDHVDEMAVDDFKAELKKFLKAFLIAAVIVSVFGVTIYVSGLNRDEKRYAMSQTEMEEEISDIITLRNYLLQWDKMYEEERYDDLCDSMNEAKTSTDYFYSNPYYKFYDAYSDMREAEKDLAKEPPYDSYAIYRMLYGYANSECAYRRFLSGSTTAPGDAALKEKLAGINRKIREIPEFTEEVLEDFNKVAYNGNWVSFEGVEKFIEERWGK